MIVTLSKTSIKTRAAHMPAKLPPITRALVAGMDHSRRGPQIWRRRCASCRCNIGGCLVTPSHELRPSGRAVYETALARYVGADDRSKTALNGVGPEVFPAIRIGLGRGDSNVSRTAPRDQSGRQDWRGAATFEAHEAKSSLSHREEGTDLGRRRLDLDHNGIFDGLQSVENPFGMPADIARSHNEFLRADSRFHFSLHNVGNRFVRVGVKRGADSRRIVDFEERHLVTLDKRLDEHIAAIQRLALDGAYRHSFDVSISRLDHIASDFLQSDSPSPQDSILSASIDLLVGAAE